MQDKKYKTLICSDFDGKCGALSGGSHPYECHSEQYQAEVYDLGAQIALLEDQGSAGE